MTDCQNKSRELYIWTWKIALPVVMVFISFVTVSAQLTDEDISALKERGRQEGWTFSVTENQVTSQPLEHLCGLTVPDNWQTGAPFDPCTPHRDLPSAYDWRDFGGCTPIKNQGGCGSCWAFGTVGPLECNILIKDSIVVDLSEQWLVSCNRSGWGCGGGWFAHKYHYWRQGACGCTGAAHEAAYPYRASDLPCDCPGDHIYRIQSWSYIGSENAVPAVSAMKQAILDYGPIAVAVSADGAMQSYGGGIFNSSNTGLINHAVVLVGWDDNQGTEGVWIMRNSWGSWWGEDGYMRIEYGCSQIGYAANYVNYPGAVRITTESLPVCSVGIVYTQQLDATGGIGQRHWSDRDGDLEGTGMILSDDGLLSGAPAIIGDISFIAHVEDQYGMADDQTYYVESLRSYACGDANEDNEINIGDGVFLINYIFKNGPAPTPVTDAGETNGDGVVNVGDAVRIINYIFKDGDPPVCP